MSKRRKKSRFTKTDVNTICELQRKIDIYESYILALVGHSSPKKDTRQYAVCIMGTDMDDWVEMAWKNITELKEKYRKYELKDNEKDGKIESEDC